MVITCYLREGNKADLTRADIVMDKFLFQLRLSAPQLGRESFQAGLLTLKPSGNVRFVEVD